MKKLKILLILILGSCLSVPCFAWRNIELAGTWKRMEKAGSLKIPIQVRQEDNDKDITIQFLENLGPVDICITTLEGCVIYGTTVDAVKMSTFLITLDNNREEVKYQIEISNKLNTVKGLFVID